ncbi:MAG TPA: hypothetical protein VM686_38015 [Polyangiaceae bacterium]|nr:hypothetical protein [Polyangiaceae bacterium]
MTGTERMIEEIRQEFPAFRLIAKRDDRLSHLIHRLLLVVTLGGQRAYLSHYHTVLGDTLYTPDTWESTPDLDRVIVLRHERVHLRQRRRYGIALMAFLYLIPFFPLGLAYGRARIEWEAYAETLRATAELKGLAAAEDEGLRRALIQRFTGAAYGWMWPFRGAVARWIDDTLGELRRA